jgi:hypothetical protein
MATTTSTATMTRIVTPPPMTPHTPSLPLQPLLPQSELFLADSDVQ